MRGLRRGRRCIICTTQISAQRSANKLCKLLNAGIYQIKACANLHVERQLKPYKQTVSSAASFIRLLRNTITVYTVPAAHHIAYFVK